MTHDALAPRRAALLADIGGTHARFTLRLDDGTYTPQVDLKSEQFKTLGAAATEGLSFLWKPLPFAVSILEAAVAVAGPVSGDRVELTNVAWSFSIEETRRQLGLERLLVINDVAALAWAVPVLERRNGKAFIEGKYEDKAEAEDRGASGYEVAAVVAVGTGLGVATWVRSATGETEVVLASEGGHRDLAATSEREWRVVNRLATRFGGHVSVERAVSGQGLANLWAALAEIDGESVAIDRMLPEEVTRRAVAGEMRAVEAVSCLCGWLGAFVGDLALTVGARGGVWLGGGVVQALGATFDHEAFRRRFVGKGRFENWLSAVPVRTIDDPLAAFRGLARALAATA